MNAFPMSTIASVFLLVATASFSAAQTYSITDLGTLQGMDYSVGRAINGSGQTTGASGSNNSNLADVFVGSGGTLTNYGTLGGDTGIGNGINASGVVAGYSTNASRAYRAFISSGTSLVDIGDLGGGSAVAYAINDSGDVVGSAVTADRANHPFLYSAGHMTDLGTLGSPNGNDWWNSAQGVNNSGVVTGTSYDADGNFFGFIWSSGKMTKMGTLGGLWSQAWAINNAGQVTGNAYTKKGGSHTFLMSPNGKMKDLGAFGKTGTSWGFAINDSGVVVGQATSGDFYHAFISTSGRKIKDLNKMIPKSSGWTLYEARGINNAGQIVCSAINAAGTQHAILLTPR